MPAYHQAGFLNTTAADGRRLRVIYLHDDDSRDEANVKQEVDVLCSFAAACKRGDGDVFGNTLPSRIYQCDVIWVRKGHHDSTSDARPHLAIQVSTEAEFMRSPKEALSGLHVYSVRDEVSRGYAGWRKMRSRKTPSKMGFCGCATKRGTRAGERLWSWIEGAIAAIEPRDSVDFGIKLRIGRHPASPPRHKYASLTNVSAFNPEMI